MSLRVERSRLAKRTVGIACPGHSKTKQSQPLRLLRFARNDGKYFCLLTYMLVNLQNSCR